MNRKILMSLGAIVFVVALSITATGAFFSDSETSTGNTLTAGSIDLKIDNTSYVTSTSTGQLIASPWTTWTIRDLTVEKFFDFIDLKPGDMGEDTISLHVDNNDSYLCADITLTSNNENTLVEPEMEDGDVSSTTGELAQQVNFLWWPDDGDNVLEVGETVLPGGPLGAAGVGATTTVTLADSVFNIWTGVGGPVPGASTRYIGKAWCFGAITPAPLAQDNATTSGPLVRGPGLTCDGSQADNTAQTDSLTADIAFRAVQSRNNGDFQCVVRQTPPPPPPAPATVTIDKEVSFTNIAVVGVDVSDFELHLFGPGGDHILTDNVPFPGLTPGVYTVSEIYSGVPANATSTAVFGGSCVEIGTTDTATMNVVSGVNPTCTITNSVSTTTPN
ncbi:MAG: SipW-dependent-type signal peptide-containing protein [Minisyncoccia bacterium]